MHLHRSGVTLTGMAARAPVEHRALRPPDSSIIPNPNDPADVPPATVGPNVSTPGDPNGVEFVDSGELAPPLPPSIIRPSSWSGWPAEWVMPLWGGAVQSLTDIAWFCVDLNASLLSTMPPYLVNAVPSLPRDWLTNPDPDKYASWEEFAKQLFWNFQLGEVFVLATAYYANGWPARFHVVDPWFVNVDMVGGRRVYEIGGIDVTADVLHVRYQSSTSDAHGHGPLEAGWSRMIAAQLLLRYATNLVTGGGIPSSVLKHPDELTATQATSLQRQWVTARMSSMGLPAVLSGGVEFETVQLSPQDMALVDLSRHNESRICVALGVPPFLMGLPSGGDSMTYSNVSSLFDFHWRAGLRPKAQTVMRALSGWALPRGTDVEVNRDAYVQPDPYTRAQTWEILIRIGVLTPEQVAEIERFATGTNFVPTGVL